MKLFKIKKNYHKLTKTCYENSQKIYDMSREIEELRKITNSHNDQFNSLYKSTDDIFNCFQKLDIIRQNQIIELKQNLNEVSYANFCLMNKDNYKKNYNPKISIIIPVYNGENYVSEAIDSALNQTYKNYEIIVVNDGSKDNTDKVVKKYKDKVSYYKKENGGVSTALNLGIKKMTGDYFLWLSHDDKIAPNHVEELVEFLRYTQGKNLIGYSSFALIDADGNALPLDSSTMCDHCKSLKSHYACILQGEVNGGSIMIPKEAFEKAGYFEEGNVISQEKEMWSRLLKYYQFINIPKVTYYIRQHEKQVTNTRKDTRKKTTEALLKIINNISDEDKIRESGTLYNFYNELYTYYFNNGFLDLAKEMKKHL